MGNLIQTLLQICGFGLLTCCGLIIAGLVFMVFTGRALLIPTFLTTIPKLLGSAVDVVTGALTGNSGADEYRYEREEREGQRGMSAADRIRAKRQNFSGDASLRPRKSSSLDLGTHDPRSLPEQAEDAEERQSAWDELTPKEKRWEQGGRRGPIEDRYDIQGPNQPKPDMRGIGVRRNRWKRDITDDEALGGVYDRDGDGFPDS